MSEDQTWLYVQTHDFMHAQELLYIGPPVSRKGTTGQGFRCNCRLMQHSSEQYCQDMSSPQHQDEKRVQEYVITVYLEKYLYSLAGDHGIFT